MLKTLLFIQLLSLLPQPSFLHIGTEEGLSQLSVLAIEEDANGFIWVGTGDGLNKFEGDKVTIYRHTYQDSTSLADDEINSIESTIDGSIMVCTKSGISQYLPENDCFRTIPGSASANRCFDMRKCPSLKINGTQWLLTAHGNILTAEDPYSGACDTLSKDISAQCFSLCDSAIYIGSRDSKVYKISNSPENIRLSADLKLSKAISDIVQDKQGRLWIAMHTNGVISYDPQNGSTHHYTVKEGLSSNLIRAMEIDDNGILWIATGNNLTLLNTEDGNIKVCSHNHLKPESLASSSLKSICKSSSGAIWIGSYYGGIDYYNPNLLSFHSTTLPNSQWNKSEAIICSINADNDGFLWIGTSRSGTFKYYPQSDTFVPFNRIPAAENALNTVAYHDNGRIVLFGNMLCGLSIYDKKVDRIIWENNSENVYSISKYSPSLYICGKQYGLKIFNFDDMSLKTVIIPGHKKGRIFSTHTDSDNLVWVGMENQLLSGTLIRQDNDSYILQIKDIHNDIKQVQDILEIDNKIWFASRSGLFRHNKISKEWDVISNKDGISTNLIRGIEADDNGYIWAATDRSILLINPQSLAFREYNKNDGLINEKYNIYANSKTMDGTIWFGGTSGITYFRPNIKQVHSKISKPFISALYVNGERCLPGFSSLLSKPIYDTRRIALEANQNNVAFTLSNIEVFSKDRIEYMMEGIDKEWQKLSPKSDIVSYANLPAGENVFKIRSANILQNEYSEISHLTIHVKSPWYQSTAFIIIVCLLVLVGVSFSIYHVKHRSSHQIAEILNKAQIDIRTAKVSSYMTIQSMNRTKDVDFMTQALKVMEENISNDKFNIDIFAEQMNMSRSNLHLRIKTAYGASATHFIRRIRIEKAMEYLKEGKLNISEIAYSVGFSSATYFATAFKQVTGVNPTEWKLSLRQDSIK